MIRSIRAKLFVLVGFTLLTMAVIAGAAVFTTTSLIQATDSLRQSDITCVSLMSKLSVKFNHQASLVTRAPSQLDINKLKKENETFTNLNKEIDQLLTELQPLLKTPDLQEHYKGINDHVAPFRAGSMKVFTQARDFLQQDAAATLLSDVFPHQDAIIQNAEGLTTHALELTESRPASIIAHAKQGNALIIAIAAIALVAGASVSLFIIQRHIVKPLRTCVNNLEGSSDETLRTSNTVSSASQSIAQGASEQAAALEETTSALEEMASMTKKNAETAQQAAALANSAQSSAQSGNTAMNRMSTAINDIEKSAGETAKIIRVIDEIAFQTNLLALNAAVEAARAGEAGRGFAVVAEEVRRLAMRSAEAAKNTSAMIEESVNNAKNGVTIAVDVAKNLDEITTAATKVNALVAEIAAASKEQSQGIDQVNKAIGEMDKVTQANAGNAEESASAAQELTTQASAVQSIVQQLTALVGRSQSNRAAAPSSHTPPTAPQKPQPKPSASKLVNAPAPHKLVKTPAPAKAAKAEPAHNPAAMIPLDDSEMPAPANSHAKDFAEFSA